LICLLFCFFYKNKEESLFFLKIEEKKYFFFDFRKKRIELTKFAITMKYEILYQELLFRLRNRIAQNSKLVAKLVDILSLEKEAVYRRLRRDVPFSFEEIVIIAKEFNISLDRTFGIDVKTLLPFRSQVTQNEVLVEIDYSILDKYLQFIKDMEADASGKIWLVTNLFPQLFYTGFENICRFYYFKWLYYSIPDCQTKPYHEIVFPDRLVQIIKDIFVYSKRIKACYIVLGNQIFKDFVNDVAYFNSIRLVKDEDVLRIKDDLFCFLDYMEDVAIKGYFDDPKNEVFIYNSDISVNTSYFYFDSKISVPHAVVWSFIFNTIISFDSEILEMMKQRIRSIIRTSTLLSITDEKQRMEYFEEQRKIVEQL